MSERARDVGSADTLSTALGLNGPDALFPWQRGLLASLLSGEDIPPSLDIPTGLGKTSVMAIWLVARAWGAPLPRRLIYVVDRRAVVDQATAVAEELRSFVDATPAMKERLGLAGRSLPISTLRGQHVDNREWLEDPGAPAIVVGTVDMIGSRLLFRGYGVSPTMRPYHAALLGVDALVALDEAHLVPPFEKLLRRIAQGEQSFGPKGEERQRLISPLRLLTLSATGRSSLGEGVRLSAADFEHCVAKRRLDGTGKRVELRPPSEGQELADALSDAAWQLVDDGKRPLRCIIFCTRRKDAAKCKQLIEKSAKKEKLNVEPPELFVGARRVRERTAAARRLEGLGFLAGKATERVGPSFLVATSAGEVGVDLDADCMACDLVAWERMVQRLGRVNRRGDVPGGAEIVVVPEANPALAKKAEEALKKKPEDRTDTDVKALDEYEASVARADALRLLRRVDGAVDGSPGAILRLNEKASDQGRAILERATTPEPLRPELSRALTEAWAMTSLRDHPGRPDVDPWIRGWNDDEPQTRVLWRTHLPVRTTGPSATTKEVKDFFDAAPPHASEVLETECSEVLDWLIERAKALSKTPEDSASAGEQGTSTSLGRDDIVGVALTRAGEFSTTVHLGDLIPPEDKKESGPWKKEFRSALVGMTLIVDARVAGLAEDGLLDAKATATPRTVDDGGQWLNVAVPESSTPAIRFRVRTAQADEPISRDGQWRERWRFPTAMSDEGDATRWLIVEGWRHDATTEEGRSVTRAQLLDDHRCQAQQQAESVAKRLQLSEGYANMLTAAARVHDEGKAAPRWQQAFNAPDRTAPYAKTAGPIKYGLLGGYRHELGTVLRVLRDGNLDELAADHRDLALHLIAAHHGFARPFIRTSGCDGAPPSMLEGLAREIALRHTRLQQKWGPWGLAWWEALLRAADQQASGNAAGGEEQSV